MPVVGILLVFATVLSAALAVWKWKDLSAALAAPFGRAVKNPASAAKVWRFIEKMFYLSGVLGLILGVIIIFSNLGPFESIARGLAVCLQTVLYGVFFGMLARILEARCLKG